MSKFLKCGRGGSSSKFAAPVIEIEESDAVERGKDFQNWKIPKVLTNKIYRRKLFNFSSDFSIRTKQGKGSLDKGGGYMNLFDEDDFWIKKQVKSRMLQNKYNSIGRTEVWTHEGNKYNLIHIGMVQIGVKTLTRKPLNASIILSLRDARHENLEDSLLGMVETSLSDGPFYFNVFPNICVSLSHPRLSDVLFLNAKIKDFEQIPQGPQSIILMYRICYKVMKNGTATQASVQSSSGRTVFFQNERRVMKWDQVQLPENWPPPPPPPRRTGWPFGHPDMIEFS